MLESATVIQRLLQVIPLDWVPLPNAHQCPNARGETLTRERDVRCAKSPNIWYAVKGVMLNMDLTWLTVSKLSGPMDTSNVSGARRNLL